MMPVNAIDTARYVSGHIVHEASKIVFWGLQHEVPMVAHDDVGENLHSIAILPTREPRADALVHFGTWLEKESFL